MGVFTSGLTQQYIIGGSGARQLATLKRYLKQNNVSKVITKRVCRNAKHAISGDLTPESVELLQVISEPLKVELAFEPWTSLATCAWVRASCGHPVGVLWAWCGRVGVVWIRCRPFWQAQVLGLFMSACQRFYCHNHIVMVRKPIIAFCIIRSLETVELAKTIRGRIARVCCVFTQPKREINFMQPRTCTRKSSCGSPSFWSCFRRAPRS